MHTSPIEQLIARETSNFRLLEHPFYRRWEAGGLAPLELSVYASQYRHFEAMIPSFLQRVVTSLPDGMARDAVRANLNDELGDPVSHIELFDRFADAVAADPAEPAPATRSLLGAYDVVVAVGPQAALGGMAAYECQAADVAASKGRGLRTHYGLSSEATAFWDHHAAVEMNHAQWTTFALTALEADPHIVAWASRIVAEAWWAFLDEQEQLSRL